jgi:transposase
MDKEHIKKLYQSGLSCVEIAEQLQPIINIGARTIQRLIAKEGLTRTRSESFKQAIKRGRMTYHKKPAEQIKHRKRIQDKVRYQVFEKYGYKCCKCGNTAKESRIQIDHIDNDCLNDSFDNLQVLCEQCNKGKYYASMS